MLFPTWTKQGDEPEHVLGQSNILKNLVKNISKYKPRLFYFHSIQLSLFTLEPKRCIWRKKTSRKFQQRESSLFYCVFDGCAVNRIVPLLDISTRKLYACNVQIFYTQKYQSTELDFFLQHSKSYFTFERILIRFNHHARSLVRLFFSLSCFFSYMMPKH